MPKWEDNTRWKKVRDRAEGKITGKVGFFATYEEMRDACYGLINENRSFENCWSASGNWCESCTWGKTWS